MMFNKVAHMRFGNMLRLVPMALLLLSCGENAEGEKVIDPIDRPLKLERDDYRDMYDLEKNKREGKLKGETSAQIAPPIPDIAPLLAAPRPPKIGNTQLVSLAVTDDVPLKDVLVELARLADVDIEIDSGIQGGINFRAKDKPFNQVIERIANLASLRYNIRQGVLRVERDVPYVVNYSVDFLNLIRNSTNSITTGGAGGGGGAAGGGAAGGATGGATGGAAGGAAGGGTASGGAGGGGGGATGLSNTTIEGQTSDDFWAALQSGITSILMTKQTNMTSQSLQPQTASQAIGLAGAGGGAAGGAGAAGGLAGGGAGGLGTMSANLEPGYYMTINRQAGIISVSATQWQHEIIKKYIEKIRTSASAQVMIEAKIIEVTLNDQYRSGIDWRRINFKSFGLQSDFNPTSTETGDFLTVTFDGGADINALATLVEEFGTSRVLSNPRLNALNNQPAVLTVTRNDVVFDIQVQPSQSSVPTGGTVPVDQAPTLTVNRTYVPIGIILNILPTIDIDNNEITLNVRPTITRRVRDVPDPAPELALRALTRAGTSTSGEVPQNLVPIVEVRELDSIVKVQSGGVMVLGGLMQQNATNNDTGVPWLSDIPLLGNLAKSVNKEEQNSELIVLIRATVVTPHGNYAPVDRRLYQKFSADPRPLAF